MAYDRQATKLADMFIKNFAKFEKHVGQDVRDAAPDPDSPSPVSGQSARSDLHAAK